jgi:hypothetical protein
MTLHSALPLPAFVLHPLTALVIACVHVYLAAGHLVELVAGNVEWTHAWKGFGALAGAYVLAALASRRVIPSFSPVAKTRVYATSSRPSDANQTTLPRGLPRGN